jgi:hypothetical protein
LALKLLFSIDRTSAQSSLAAQGSAIADKRLITLVLLQGLLDSEQCWQFDQQAGLR